MTQENTTTTDEQNIFTRESELEFMLTNAELAPELIQACRDAEIPAFLAEKLDAFYAQYDVVNAAILALQEAHKTIKPIIIDLNKVFIEQVQADEETYPATSGKYGRLEAEMLVAQSGHRALAISANDVAENMARNSGLKKSGLEAILAALGGE